jgi:hypothetical protein
MMHSAEYESRIDEFREVIEKYLGNALETHGGTCLWEIYDELYNEMRESVYNIERERYG